MNTKKPKVRLWSVLTALTAILTIAAIVGNMIANQYATTLNVALNASTYKIIKGDTTEDTEYFKEGFASDEEREAYEAELCATVEAEGAALLKNDNAALPLAGSAKVSLFGHGSVDLMYGGTGSGSVDTSKAPQPEGSTGSSGHSGQPDAVGSVQVRQHDEELQPHYPGLHLGYAGSKHPVRCQ